jgi:hypothetical protein
MRDGAVLVDVRSEDERERQSPVESADPPAPSPPVRVPS